LARIFTSGAESITWETVIWQLVDFYRSGVLVSGPLGFWLGENSGMSVLDALEGVLHDYAETFQRIQTGQVLPPD